jgi:hypothetical protein
MCRIAENETAGQRVHSCRAKDRTAPDLAQEGAGARKHPKCQNLIIPGTKHLLPSSHNGSATAHETAFACSIGWRPKNLFRVLLRVIYL